MPRHVLKSYERGKRPRIMEGVPTDTRGLSLPRPIWKRLDRVADELCIPGQKQVRAQDVIRWIIDYMDDEPAMDRLRHDGLVTELNAVLKPFWARVVKRQRKRNNQYREAARLYQEKLRRDSPPGTASSEGTPDRDGVY